MWYSRFCKVWSWTGGVEILVEVIAEPPWKERRAQMGKEKRGTKAKIKPSTKN